MFSLEKRRLRRDMIAILKNLKNVLELKVYDEDMVTKDDRIFTVFYDAANVKPGQTIHKRFKISELRSKMPQEKKMTLEVEFKMETISDDPERLITNGILVAREVSCLEVWLDDRKNEEMLAKYNIEFLVDGSFEEAHTMTQNSKIFYFHFVKNWKPELKVNIKSKILGGTLLRDTFTEVLPLEYSLVGKEPKVALSVAKDVNLELQLKANACLEDLDVRLGCDLCGAEQDFLRERKKVVKNALEGVLNQKLQEHEVPVIAVMATGGGMRAMSALYGHLLGLQKLKFLDCVTYLTGASGSTWAMRNLYEDHDWSQNDLMGPIHKAREYVARSKSSVFSLEALLSYNAELSQRVKAGHSVSFTDVWSLMIEHMFHDKQSDNKLSDQQKAVSKGQNPLPIYVALNVKEDTQTTYEFREWCEFSPYEVGFSKYGAFIPSEDFGSEFFMGQLMKKRQESKICYLEGLWSNIFSLNMVDVWNVCSSLNQKWQWPFLSKEEDSNQPSVCQMACFCPPSDISDIINGVLTHRPLGEWKPNFLRGLQLCTNYHQHEQFSVWQDTNLDMDPNHLTPLDKDLCLVDAGYFINTSCPPLLRKERDVDVILSFDYNLLETRFHSIEHMGEYCSKMKIPFPNIELTDADRKNPKECYVFDKDPNAPIVIHFPLVNDSFTKFKEPGIKRSSAEKAEGNMDFATKNSPYKMTDLTYTENDFDKLINLSDYNIQNNRHQILQALKTAKQRRRDSKKLSHLPSF
ncbi:cytosolic phospholipase A2 delta-like isoform X2 [Hemicordylus capensis]|uniref:cytosolic phospholipase A2 delta-like isoform X2 n=1 Tax=Hemicordylus capensis TaxID=884348 RepID=UPI002302232C|nr:cytosolic phospholipase A2 delta-like isoform X2 [Hemicordylus capensis]